ncbi:nuclear transport factor 2 family protein [Domibacillus sp. DTU_2020_1001157_1_SI_ALB_TIR_016]|uniref:nuclear transport factor 2 family protein n=1 Tax=Domibacillus sp. DTU_2020_1001157_1_SI_ALB_TIR_016 TaxID=3077789 RepID=UPI0028EADDC2|nr:nuclear transport factor 2 family protein [Domibacillus sp. DTU_2020_1001157_1_SI_ALB_TIR_016]WNS79571.1 nuclear transport factor 2 family protein [Domibacillus sp. DTU_2020_1001157_1_SI_ALB_TIR_016]
MNANHNIKPAEPNRAEIQKIFLDFSSALEANNLSSIKNHFTPDAVAKFSHLGELRGVDAIIKGLAYSGPELDVIRYKVTNSYVAVSGGQASQSAYMTGILADDLQDGELDSFSFGGHFANTYIRTNEGWKISYLRFEMDWQRGNSNYVTDWKLPDGTGGWRGKVVAPMILSELDAPWQVFPKPDERGTDEEQVAEAYIRYAWALDQADFSLLTTAFTEDAKADMSPFGPMDGRREIVSLLKMLRNGQPYMQHAATNFRMNVTGDTATMDIYRVVPFIPTRETLDVPIFGARYESRLRRDAGMWKFKWLHYIPGWIHGEESI